MSQEIASLNKAIIDYNGEGLDALQLLVATVDDLNVCSRHNQLPINLAAFHGHVAVAELLVGAGADIHTLVDGQRYLPLHCAAKSGHLSMVRFLLGQGANVNAQMEQSGDHVPVSRLQTLELQAGSTPLHFAARMGKHAVVCLLIEHGAMVNAHETDDGSTPLHEAVIGWSAMKKVPSRSRRSRLRWQYLQTIQSLIAAGADVSLTDENDMTPKTLAETEFNESDENQVMLLQSVLSGEDLPAVEPEFDD